MGNSFEFGSGRSEQSREQESSEPLIENFGPWSADAMERRGGEVQEEWPDFAKAELLEYMRKNYGMQSKSAQEVAMRIVNALGDFSAGDTQIVVEGKFTGRDGRRLLTFTKKNAVGEVQRKIEYEPDSSSGSVRVLGPDGARIESFLTKEPGAMF